MFILKLVTLRSHQQSKQSKQHIHRMIHVFVGFAGKGKMWNVLKTQFLVWDSRPWRWHFLEKSYQTRSSFGEFTNKQDIMKTRTVKCAPVGWRLLWWGKGVSSEYRTGTGLVEWQKMHIFLLVVMCEVENHECYAGPPCRPTIEDERESCRK